MYFKSHLPKIIMGQKIFLRDFIESDIDDHIRWEIIETEWQEWDAPWENDGAESFNPVQYRNRMIEILANNRPSNQIRRNFQICVNGRSKKHIGWINAYYIDENYTYTKIPGNLAIGISIPDLNSRRKGYGTEAWYLYINYLMENGIEDIYTQTWSGNFRVLGLMHKLGFVELNREKDARIVRGELYDGLTLKLNVNKFKLLELN